MLKSIDVLIGLVVVLLALSMAVTVITQVITTVLNSRGRHLRRGLADLLQQLDPALTARLSDAVAARVLTHPLVSGSQTFIAEKPSAVGKAVGWVRRLFGGARFGNVVHREEFTKLLFGLATGQGAHQLEGTALSALKSALANNGIADPDQVLKNIRTVALQLERSNPELSNATRQNMAILQEAGTELVAKINGWFDQTMDRTSQRFTASTRAITFVAACLVAFGLQVDTPSLVNRLAADDQLREAFVQEAKALDTDRKQQEGAGASATAGSATNTSPTGPQQDEMVRKYRAFLATNGLIVLPSTNGVNGWWTSFKTANTLGISITALLLSLGAPFWYSMLGKLLQLRSVLAVKDDVQRTARQSTEAPGAGVAMTGASAPSRLPRERDDSTAAG